MQPVFLMARTLKGAKTRCNPPLSPTYSIYYDSSFLRLERLRNRLKINDHKPSNAPCMHAPTSYPVLRDGLKYLQLYLVGKTSRGRTIGMGPRFHRPPTYAVLL